MKALLLILIFFLSIFHFSHGQRTCGSEVHLENIKSNNPSRYDRIQQIEQHTNQFIRGLNNNKQFSFTPSIIRIPVVVHVLHNGGAIGTGLNISMAQIQSQIDVLNEDFRRLNADAGNTPAQFQPVAADVEIEFYLACVDPNGNPTNGVVRINGESSYTLVRDGGGEIDEVATGIKLGENGSPAWPADRYLNIWICNLNNDLLGYAQFPNQLASQPHTDGVVVNTQSFGTVGNVVAPFDEGRTATHEVGHWLNLYHIWGDASGCSSSDAVDDTPNQNTEYYGCPPFPQSSCGNNDMFMNYMDYTNDACMNLFTQGQRNRMRSLFTAGGVRRSLVENPYGISLSGLEYLCSTDSYTLHDIPSGSTASWSVTPSYLFSGSTSGSGTTANLTPSSNSGSAVLTFTISTSCGNVTVNKSIWVGEAGLAGISFSNPVNEYEYFCSSDYGNTFRIYSSTPNTTWEVRMLNWPSLTVAYTSSSTYQSNQAYIWSYVPMPNNGYYVFEVRGTNGCGTTDWLPGYEIEYVDCSSLEEDPFILYPNPASDIITISIENIIGNELNKNTQFEVSLFNQQGQRVIDNTKVETEIVMNISSLKNGFYYFHILFKEGLIRRQVKIER